MFSENQDLSHHFSNFYKDNTLLIQFILVEFLQIHQSTIQFKVLVQEQIDSIHSLDAFAASLSLIFFQLVGDLPQHQKSSFSRWTKGSLTRFKEYCEHFSLNSDHKNKQHLHLHKAAHHAWVSAIHSVEMINSLYKKSANQESELNTYILSLKRIINTLQVRFNQVMRYIPKVIDVYWNDENVMLCLLRKRAQLTEIYGIDFLSKYFKWPINIESMMEVLIKRYQERGFNDLLPIIEQMQDKKIEVYESS